MSLTISWPPFHYCFLLSKSICSAALFAKQHFLLNSFVQNKGFWVLTRGDVQPEVFFQEGLSQTFDIGELYPEITHAVSDVLWFLDRLLGPLVECTGQSGVLSGQILLMILRTLSDCAENRLWLWNGFRGLWILLWKHLSCEFCVCRHCCVFDSGKKYGLELQQLLIQVWTDGAQQSMTDYPWSECDSMV